MTKIVVIGYASIDYPAVLDGFFKADQTVMIKQRPADAFPRPGGCPLYVARPIAQNSQDVSIITWVGDDDLGNLFRSWVKRDDVGIGGVATAKSGNTPVCFMIYQEDGSCCCCFDPGMLGQEQLEEQQKQLLREADLLCVTVGPPDIGRQALSLISDECEVAWVAKNDPLSFPIEYRERLGQRANYVFCNEAERKWIDDAIAGRTAKHPLIVQTNGANAVVVDQGPSQVAVDVAPIDFNDASGAGDTLAGGCLRAIVDGTVDPSVIAESGIQSAAELLRGRSKET